MKNLKSNKNIMRALGEQIVIKLMLQDGDQLKTASLIELGQIYVTAHFEQTKPELSENLIIDFTKVANAEKIIKQAWQETQEAARIAGPTLKGTFTPNGAQAMVSEKLNNAKELIKGVAFFSNEVESREFAKERLAKVFNALLKNDSNYNLQENKLLAIELASLVIKTLNNDDRWIKKYKELRKELQEVKKTNAAAQEKIRRAFEALEKVVFNIVKIFDKQEKEKAESKSEISNLQMNHSS